MKQVKDIKAYLLEIHNQSNLPLDKPWCEGYVSALQDEGIITKDEFTELIGFIVNS